MQSTCKDFNRQVVLGSFIIDIYSPSLKLVIEVDGDSHDLKYGDRAAKESYLTSLGITLLVITNQQIKQQLAEVLTVVSAYC